MHKIFARCIVTYQINFARHMQRKENRYDENIDTDAFTFVTSRGEKNIFFHQLFNWMLFNFWPLTEFLKLKYFTELAFGFLIFAKLSSWLKKRSKQNLLATKCRFSNLTTVKPFKMENAATYWDGNFWKGCFASCTALSNDKREVWLNRIGNEFMNM